MLYSNNERDNQQTLSIIQEVCINKILESDVPSILFCLLAIKDGFVNDAIIDGVNDKKARQALRELAYKPDIETSKPLFTNQYNRWLESYKDFVYRNPAPIHKTT
ncbi:hypothetical protein R6Y90_18885 [Alteromonas macleodii]|uniref:hypothetical protein n=1 Tax=Alteromonas macleodii TaxID=28108 RepID=UPI002981BD23|nr:hypothetical protein [Alteromonas macleodii]MDW5287017.1 hypothetical protein [Alteromonas macleodii]